MAVSLDPADLDRLAPFGLLCDEHGTITHAGPSMGRVAGDLVGRRLFDCVEAVRPLGLTDLESLRRLGDSMAVLRMASIDLSFRFQVLETRDPHGVLLVGTPVVATSEDLERRGLSAADFSPIDQTPDLLLLRRGQERSLTDLRMLNAELVDTARELRVSNRLLAKAEAQYRRLVDLQPLVMYIDRLGPTPTVEFISGGAEAWLGYPLRRWLEEPGFFFSIVHEDDHARVWAAHLRAERDDSAFDEEFRLRAADGRTVWSRAVDSVVTDEDAPHGRRIGFMLDITAGKTAELELRQTMSRLTTLLTYMQSGVLVEDAERRVILANDALCAIFRSDLATDALVGLPASAATALLVPPGDDPSAFLRRTEDLLRRRWPAVGEVIALADSRVLEFDFQPIVDEGVELGALWMFRDVTDAVRSADALERARDEAIAASDAKSQFLASMSHEIRTPMHGVLATIDLLRTTPLDAEQRELTDVVSSSATALVGIINDILDLQKVEAGRIDLSEEPFGLVAVAAGVVDLLTPQARAQGLDLTLYADPAIPDALLGDPLRIRQVLLNLVGNAVKFTAEGSVAVDLRWTSPSPAASGQVDVVVRDTGRGIPADKLDGIFDPFVQARSGQDGTGLGLAIAERLVGLMGSRLSVASVVGEGTAFSFQLRLEEALDPGTPVEPPPPSAGPDRIVLVVDDSAASRGLLLRQLARIGVPARAVDGCAGALEALGTGAPYGLVLLDVDMPGMDGPATAAAIRRIRDPRVARVPVVGLVAGDSAAERRRAREAGMEAQLAKPVDIGALREVVDRWVGPA